MYDLLVLIILLFKQEHLVALLIHSIDATALFPCMSFPTVNIPACNFCNTHIFLSVSRVSRIPLYSILHHITVVSSLLVPRHIIISSHPQPRSSLDRKDERNQKKKKEKKRDRENLPVCRRRCGVGYGGAGLRGQSAAEVGVLAVGGCPGVGRRGVRVRLGGVREPRCVLHYPDTVYAASLLGGAIHRHRVPAHSHQAAESEPARQRHR